MNRLFGYRALSTAAIVCVGLTYAAFVQVPDSNQNVHYALTKALSRGTPTIGETRGEVGDLGTWDISIVDGKVYAAKAPGLALAAVPLYSVLEHLDVRTSGDPRTMLWLLHLWVVVVPGIVLLFLIRFAADAVDPGIGGITATTIGLATLLLPFSTLLFAHTLSTTLCFAAFVLLWKARSVPGIARPLLAGIAVGLAVVVEYPQAIVAVVLAIYVATRRSHPRYALAYLGGLFVGVLPLLAYNSWAFGSPFELPYAAAVTPGVSPGAVLDNGIFGFRPPSVAVFTHALLLEKFGLLLPAPVLAASLVGIPLLYRRGYRSEAAVVAAVVVLFPLYLASFFAPGGPFGGRYAGDVGPGPRYLIAVLPFLAVPLALVYRRYPGPTGALALVSFLMMLGPTSTRPQAGWDGHVIDRLTSKSLEGYGDTVTTFVGVTGPARIGPVILVVGAAIVAGVASAHPRKPTARDVTLAVSAVLAWGVGWVVIPTVLRASRVSDDVSAVLGFTVAALFVGAFCLLHKRVSRARLGVRA